MAIVASNLYSGRVITGDSAYPYGKAQDIINGEKGTGTPLRASWVNDTWGFLQALLDEADIAPSGTPDGVGASQYLDALKEILTPVDATKAILIAQGLSGEYGFFEKGFTYNESGDVGIDSDGNIWTYNGALPFEVEAGAVPSEPSYSVHEIKASEIPTDGGDSVQDVLNKTNNLTVVPLTNFTDRREVIADSDLTYSAFPAASLKTWVDPSSNNEYLIQAYYTGNKHAGADATPKIYSRRSLIRVGSTGEYVLQPTYGGRVLLKDTDTGVSQPRMHGMVKCADNSLLCFINAFSPDNLVWMYSELHRSTDGGLTWINEGQWQDNTGNVIADEAGFASVLRSGRIVAFNRVGGANVRAWFNYSDDNGATWSRTDNIDLGVTDGAGRGVMEGFIFETQTDNQLICILRQTEANAPYTTSYNAVFTRSDDGGLTWIPVSYTNIPDMTANNAAVMYHEDFEKYEIVYFSRHGYTDGYASMYQTWTSESDVVNGVWQEPQRFPFGLPSKDLGYPATAKRSDGKVYLQWYSGVDTKTSIQQMSGYVGSKVASKHGESEVIKNTHTGFAHTSTEVGLFTKNSEITHYNVARTLPPRFDSLSTTFSLGGEQYLYDDSSAVTIYSASPAPSGTAQLDMQTLLGGLYNRYAGGYVLEVIAQFRTDGVAQAEIKIGNSTHTKRVLFNTFNSVSSGEQYLFSSEILAPTYRLGSGDEGKLDITFTNQEQIRFVNVRCLGYLRANY